MIFKTQSGSTYEVNTKLKQLRRLSGTHQPTERQGQDGEWKNFEEIGSVSNGIGCLTIGEPAMIIWNQDEVPALSALGGIKMLTTGLVVSIEEEN